jgi:hypothetical protein
MPIKRIRFTWESLILAFALVAIASLLVLGTAVAQAATPPQAISANSAACANPVWGVADRPSADWRAPRVRVQLDCKVPGVGVENPGDGAYDEKVSPAGPGMVVFALDPMRCNRSISWQDAFRFSAVGTLSGPIVTYERDCGGFVSGVNRVCPVGSDKQFSINVSVSKGQATKVTTWKLHRANGENIHATLHKIASWQWEGFVKAPSRGTQLDLGHPAHTGGFVVYRPLGAVDSMVRVGSNCYNPE